jgi:hypothetical protein
VSNPYLAPEAPVVVQNRQSTITDVIDVETGQRLTLGGNTITISVDPFTGGREIEERTIQVRSDGRILNPNEPVYACGCGCNSKPLLTSHTVRFCAFCQVPLALGHARTWDDSITKAEACPRCWEPGHTKRAIKRFITWLRRI